MAKTKLSEYDVVAGNNTDVSSINIDEGCSPAGINNAIRAIMSHLKAFQNGTSGDSLTVTGDVTVNTPTGTDNSQKPATTAFVQSKIGAFGTMANQNASAVAITGGTVAGVTVGGSTIGTNSSGNKTISTSAPSGGVDGDIWYQV